MQRFKYYEVLNYENKVDYKRLSALLNTGVIEERHLLRVYELLDDNEIEKILNGCSELNNSLEFIKKTKPKTSYSTVLKKILVDNYTISYQLKGNQNFQLCFVIEREKCYLVKVKKIKESIRFTLKKDILVEGFTVTKESFVYNLINEEHLKILLKELDLEQYISKISDNFEDDVIKIERRL